MIVATYYTDSKYKTFAQNLANSCKELGLYCAAYAERDQKDWRKNVYRKPHVILKAMNGYPMENILFIDADARLRRYPIDFFKPNPPEVACYFEGTKPVSGTVYLQNSERVRAFVDEWARGCDIGLNMNEDFHWMDAALRKFPTLNVQALSASYFWKPEMRGRFPTAIPIVEHFTVGEHTFK